MSSTGTLAVCARRVPWAVIGAAIGLTVAKLGIYALLARQPVDLALCQFDCRWYITIATKGYDAHAYPVLGLMQANWAFFPLYPTLMWAVDLVTSWIPERSGFVVCTVCCIGLMVAGARYRAFTRQETAPWDWLLLATVWPYSFYFHAGYAEALYAWLTTEALLLLARQRPLEAGWVTALVTATRPTGFLLAAWLGIDGLRCVIARGIGLRSWRCLLPAAVGSIGLLVFMAVLYARIGDPLAFVHIQAGWLHHPSNPLQLFLDGFSPGQMAHFEMGPYEAIWAWVGFAATVWLAATSRFAEAWLVAAAIIVALSGGQLASMPRFVACNPAFMFAVADVLAAIRWPMLRYALLLGMADAEFFLVRAWYHSPLFLM